MLLLVVWLLDSFILKFSTFLANFIPLVLRVVLALTVLAPSYSMILLAHWRLFNKKLPGLVTVGIFAHVRHPM